MRAISVSRFGGPEEMVLAEIPEPSPAAGEVKIAIHAAGVNPVDTYVLSGTYSYRPDLPYVPGMDGAGEVVECGSGVRDLRPGDRVYIGRGRGTYAEYCSVSADRVYKLPAGMTFAQGAALGVPYYTAHRALIQVGRLNAGETVLVHGGSGAVGIAAIQIARAAGAFVVATASTEEGRGFVRTQGAALALAHADTPEHMEALAKAAPGGFDLIVEMLANRNLPADLALIRRSGRIVIVGNRGTLDFNPRLIMAKDAVVLGTSILNASTEQIEQCRAAINAGLEIGTLLPVVAREFPLAHAAEAHRLIMASHAFGKFVLDPEKAAL